jgi:hypothetical protein
VTTPAYQPGANQSFSAGIDHLANEGRSNLGSVTLDGGLQAGRMDGGLSPHGVLNSAMAVRPDYAGIQRVAGTYAPGSMGRLTDELSAGSDDYTSNEE